MIKDPSVKVPDAITVYRNTSWVRLHQMSKRRGLPMSRNMGHAFKLVRGHSPGGTKVQVKVESVASKNGTLKNRSRPGFVEFCSSAVVTDQERSRHQVDLVEPPSVYRQSLGQAWVLSAQRSGFSAPSQPISLQLQVEP